MHELASRHVLAEQSAVTKVGAVTHTLIRSSIHAATHSHHLFLSLPPHTPSPPPPHLIHRISALRSPPSARTDDIGLALTSLKLDSQAKYGALSRGDASIFMRFPPATYREKIWDHCAGVAVVQEAGAVITDAMGNLLDFSLGRHFPFLNGGIVAATPSMHRAIMASLDKIRAAEGGPPQPPPQQH